MKKTLAAAIVVVGVAACGHSTPQHLTSQEKTAVATLQSQLATCATKDHTLKSFKACAVPPGHSQAFEICVIKAARGYLLPGGKARTEAKLATCVEKDR